MMYRSSAAPQRSDAARVRGVWESTRTEGHAPGTGGETRAQGHPLGGAMPRAQGGAVGWGHRWV